jgi:hypothetical protein
MEHLERTEYFNNAEPTTQRERIRILQERLKWLNDQANEIKAELHTLTNALYR